MQREVSAYRQVDVGIIQWVDEDARILMQSVPDQQQEDRIEQRGGNDERDNVSRGFQDRVSKKLRWMRDRKHT